MWFEWQVYDNAKTDFMKNMLTTIHYPTALHTDKHSYRIVWHATKSNELTQSKTIKILIDWLGLT